MGYNRFKDQELIVLLKEGDGIALRELYNRHWGAMFLHAVKMLRDEDKAKDVVQETFINLWKKSDTLTLRSNLSVYLFSAVRNRVLNLIRDENVRKGYIDLFSLYVDEHANDTLEAINKKELLLAIEVSIRKLPNKMKQVFELSRKDQLSHREIANKLNISEGTVSRQISNALKILRTDLDKPESLILALLLYQFK